MELFLIVFLPLIGSIITGFFGKILGLRLSHFISFSVFLGNITGQIFSLFILTVAAGEAAIGLAILVVYFRNAGNIDVNKINKMSG